MENKRDVIKEITNTTLVKNQTFHFLTLIFATIIILVISGILGAFRSGKFEKTYDYVKVNQNYQDIDYNSEVFKFWSKESKEVIEIRTELIYHEPSGTFIEIEYPFYKGYYSNYFWESSWFYVDTLTNSLIIMLFYITLTNFLISRNKAKNGEYLYLKDEINEIVLVKNEIPSSSFEPFMEKWNYGRKVNQHISNVKFKLSKLESKTKYEIKKEFYIIEENGDSTFKIPDRVLTPEEEKYLKTKKELELLITEQYIKTNIRFSKVKHFKTIHPSFVTTGKNSIIESTDEYSSIKSDTNKRSEDFTKKGLFGLALSMVIASVLSFTLFSAEEGWLLILYSIFIRLLPLVLQVVMSLMYINTHFEQQLIPTLKNRLNIINIYLSDKNKEAKGEF